MILRLMVLAALLLTAWPQAAVAKPKMRSLGELPLLISDGRRYVAFDDGDWTRVTDTYERRLFAIRNPEGCDVWQTLLGGNQILWSCRKRSPDWPYVPDSFYPMLADLTTGEVRVSPGSDEILARQGEHGGHDAHGADVRAVFMGIGSRWMRVLTAGRHVIDDFLVDWRTGEVRDTPPPSAAAYLDLDAAAASTDYCEPLKRPEDPDYDRIEDIDPFLPKPIWGWTALQGDGRAPGELYLERCHRKKRKLLSSSAWSFGLTPDATWWTRQTELTIQIRHGRKRTLKYPITLPIVTQTDRRLYLQRRSPGDQTEYQTYSVNLPQP